MVLQKALVPVGYQGLQTKIDPKTAPLGTFVTIENLNMTRSHELVKRDGISVIGASSTPTNTIAMYALNNEFGAITDKALFAYAANTDTFINKGSMSAPMVSATPIIANTYTQSLCDSAVTLSNYIHGSTWEDSRGGVHCAVRDLASGVVIQNDILLTSTGIRPKAVACGVFIYFFWIEAGATTLKCQRYNTVTNAFSTASTITTNMGSNFTYDVVSMDVNTTLVASFLVVTAEATPQLKAYFWNANLDVIGTSGNGLANAAVLTTTNVDATLISLSIALPPAGGNFTVAFHNGTDKKVYAQAFTLIFSALATQQVVGNATTDPGFSLTSTFSATGTLTVIATTYSTAFNTYLGSVATITSTPVVTLASLQYTQLGLCSKAFYYNSNTYFVVGYNSSLQSTYFLVRDDGVTSARLFAQVAGGNPTRTNSLSTISIRNDRTNTYIIDLLKVTKIVAVAGGYNSTTSVYSEQINLTPYAPDNKSLNKSLYIAGGCVKAYDGSSTIVEQGFHLFPEFVSLTSGVGVIGAGSYSYKAVWEWVDNYGQIVRSSTSVASVITVGANSNITVVAKSLPITAKETRFSDTRTPVVLAIYRTLNNGTTYYRVNQDVSTFVYNNPAATTVTFVDNIPDATLQTHGVIYTTGGVYDNIALPSANLLTLGKNRIIVAGVDTEPNKIFFSKEKEEGLGVEFSAELSMLIDNFGGDITALAAMDDKILIFKKNVIYFIAGQGPDKLGNGSFTTPQLVSADAGCNTPQSIVLTGQGVMFKSLKGIYMVDRQLQVTYKGQAIDSYNSLTVTSGVNLPDQNHVHFTTIEGTTLVYDTYFDWWYTFTGQVASGATVIGSAWYLANSANVYKSVAGQVYDGTGSPIISKLKTSWISVAGIEGYQRVYGVLFLGENESQIDRLKINLFYDFKDYLTEALSIRPALSLTAYGVDSPYGTGTPYGGSNDGTAQFMARNRQQKCTAIQIEILDDFPAGIPLSSFKFSDLALLIGIKQGYNKNLSPQTRRFT